MSGRKTAYETCWNCDGSGLEVSPFNGEPTTCHTCKGNTVVRARDERGRFTAKEVRP